MHRRLFSISMLSLMVDTGRVAARSEKQIERDGMRFVWRHHSDRLFGDLSAPTQGWLAVGFNRERQLHGTRFLIGVVGSLGVHAELHVADPPRHRSIEALGGISDLRDVSGSFENGRSQLTFSLPHRSTDRFAVDLSPGRSVHLMLAWSNEPDFSHHSAWRRHVDVTL